MSNKEKKERVVPKMIGSASSNVKRLYRNFPRSVRRMVQEAEHFAKYTEYAIMAYDVPVKVEPTEKKKKKNR